MKKSFIIIAALVFVSAAITGSYLFYRNATSATYIFTDVTDPKVPIVEIDNILDSVLTDIHTWGAASVSVSPLTDFDYNRIQTITLKSAFMPLANPKLREKEIDRFKGKVKQAISNVYAMDSGRTQSSLYVPLIRSLNALTENHVAHKRVFVYSDLLLNTVDSFSAYNTNDLELAITNPERVQEILLHQATPKNLSGITVYFVYSAKSTADEKRHEVMTNIFKSILTDHHAQVEITSNL